MGMGMGWFELEILVFIILTIAKGVRMVAQG